MTQVGNLSEEGEAGGGLRTRQKVEGREDKRVEDIRSQKGGGRGGESHEECRGET